MRETRERLSQIESELQKQLLPRDPNDERNIFLEVRAERAARNRRSSRPICSACIRGLPNGIAGRSK
jgi:hypothetical protein